MLKGTEILPNLFCFQDLCNVYLIREEESAIAVDFGSGAWLHALPDLGIKRLEHLFLTHAHEDQCAGLAKRRAWPFEIHAPSGEEAVMSPQRKAEILPPWRGQGCPMNYCPPRKPIPHVVYDIAGNGHFFWRGRRLRFLHTPGHGPHACSLLLDHKGRQILFCGDAVYAEGTIWQPFHLEWDHWTGAGAFAAWEGIERLRGLAIDLLAPSHGPLITENIPALLRKLSTRLLAFYRAKGQISPGTRDAYLTPQGFVAGALQYLPHLYQYASNGYLLVSEQGTGLIVDPYEPEMPALESLLAELKIRPTVAVATHYHFDHCDGIPYLRKKYGVKAWLHPLIAEALSGTRPLPWLGKHKIAADQLWPEEGRWRWEEYEFVIAPWPGQTRWHCLFMTTIDGRRVAFAGDSFTPTSKWNGTGGFCAYNDSRFAEGFIPSAQRLLAWQPEIIAAGHNNTYLFSRRKFRRIITWARRAEAAVRALCPSGDLEQDYYVIHRLLRERSTP